MATDGFASWIDSGDLYAAADLRRLDTMGVMPGGPTSAPFSARAGRRVNGAGLQVSIGGSPESWTCTPGPCEVYDPTYSTQGGWRAEIPNAKSGTIGARPGTGTSRIDLIVVRIYDAGAIGSGPKDVVVERIVGTAGQTPVAPTPPVGSITFEVARLTVPASGSITVTHSTARSVAAGGILPVATTSEVSKLKTDSVAYRGLVVDNAQTNRLERFNGTDFKAVPDDIDVCVGQMWGAGFDPAVHQHKMFSYAIATTANSSANVEVLDLSTQFAGVTGAVATTWNGDSASGASVVRHMSAFISGNKLLFRCENAAGAPTTDTAVKFTAVVHGWV